MFPPNLCPGCNCYNETEERDVSGIGTDIYAPCCDGEPSPCSYKVIFKCDHNWPAITSEGACVGLPTVASDRSIFKWFYQVHLLTKECVGSCLYSEVRSMSTTGVAGWACNKMVPCDGDILFDGEQHTFPQMLEGPPIQPVRACYAVNVEVDEVICLPGCEVPAFGPTPGFDITPTFFHYRLWSLDISAGTLTWNFTGVPGRGNPMALFASLGKSAPLYIADNPWDKWGRNSMTLSNLTEWPSLPPHICVEWHHVGLPKVCSTNESQCNCCDNGSDTADFIVSATGCEGFAGTHLVHSERTCQEEFEASYPGADYPSPAPCCVWPFTLGTGDGCTFEGTSYSGELLVVIYCDGDNYQGDVYCFDTDLNEWVNKSALSVEWRCLSGCEEFEVGDAIEVVCCTWVVSFEIPEMPCCCPEPEECCDCESLPTLGSISDGVDSLSLEKTCVDGTHIVYSVVSALGTLCGETIISGTVECTDGVWTLILNGGSPVALDWDGDCEAVVLTGTYGACPVTVTI